MAATEDARTSEGGAAGDGRRALARRHLRVGLWLLAVSVTVGVVLEALHGFKAGFYLDLSMAPRRHVWTLAHAHGTLLGLLHLAFGLGVERGLLGPLRGGLRAASGCLVGASVAIPAGFFLGGVWVHGGDPGLGILLVPPGGVALVVAVVLAALAVERG